MAKVPRAVCMLSNTTAIGALWFLISPQLCSSSAPQLFNTAALQLFSSSALQLLSSSGLQLFSCLALQLLSSSDLLLFSCSAVHFFNSLAPQLFNFAAFCYQILIFSIFPTRLPLSIVVHCHLIFLLKTTIFHRFFMVSGEAWARLDHKFDLMYAKRAFVHW